MKVYVVFFGDLSIVEVFAHVFGCGGILKYRFIMMVVFTCGKLSIFVWFLVCFCAGLLCVQVIEVINLGSVFRCSSAKMIVNSDFLSFCIVVWCSASSVTQCQCCNRSISTM